VQTETAMSSATKTDTLLAALVDLLNVDGLKRVHDWATVSARLLGLGLGDVCSRCLGSGSYGPLSVQGGRCFKCDGHKTQAPKLTKKLVERVRLAVERGDLAAYAARLQAAAKARREAKGAFERAWSGYSRCAWYRFFYEKDPITGRDRGIDGFPIRGSLIDLTQDAYRRAVDLDIKIKLGRGTDQVVADLLVACDDYTKALEILDRAHAICLERGLYDIATAEHATAKGGSWEAEQRSATRWREVAAEIWAEAASA
jgi:hypothetical protein